VGKGIRKGGGDGGRGACSGALRVSGGGGDHGKGKRGGGHSPGYFASGVFMFFRAKKGVDKSHY